MLLCHSLRLLASHHLLLHVPLWVFLLSLGKHQHSRLPYPPLPPRVGGGGRSEDHHSISSLPRMETSASSAHLCFQLTQLFLMCAKLIGQKLLSSRRVSPARPTSWLSARASLYYTCNQDASLSHPHCILVVINYIAQIPKEPLNVSIPWSFISKWAR